MTFIAGNFTCLTFSSTEKQKLGTGISLDAVFERQKYNKKKYIRNASTFLWVIRYKKGIFLAICRVNRELFFEHLTLVYQEEEIFTAISLISTFLTVTKLSIF